MLILGKAARYFVNFCSIIADSSKKALNKLVMAAKCG